MKENLCKDLPMDDRQVMDDSRKEWCYLAKSTTVVGVPFMPDPVMVTWDGAVYTRHAELCFFHGEGMTPVMQRQKTWLDGWIPIVKYDWQEGAVRYDASADDGYVPTGLYDFVTGEAAREGFAEWRTDQDWENCLLAWPTEVLPVDDLRVTATTRRFRETKYREGIMSYRNGQHLHQYITANTANQDLLAGDAKQALLDIYHVLLHSGSTHEGYENEVEPWADRLVHGAQPPHAWGASKIATLVRNMFVLEYGGRLGLEPEKRDLYLFTVVSPAWAKPGETIAVKNVLADFGTVSASMSFRENGATVVIDKAFHTDPGQIVIRIPYFVKDVTFTSDARTATRKGNAVCLSADATRVSFDWQLDPAADETVFQDILLAYRREPGWWQDHRDRMPEKPKGFLTDEEKAHEPQPLSFELVKQAFLAEYRRRGNWPTLEAVAFQ